MAPYAMHTDDSSFLSSLLNVSLGVLGTYLGVLVESRVLLGRSSSHSWGCLGILGDTLGSLVALGVSSDDSLEVSGGSLGSPCRGQVHHTVRRPMCQRVLSFVAAA